ncbi:hypothetical protein CROQUDRAFT_95448 [Cronartium quercuum f. sp. fusiforme G11]|uniref:RNase H type-1 domain-containing protein n=1 Tax=Cronartium quercuum f. sp. fusiforme G11 TaxID=708437 RepID=A0A9P6TA06_9BASI|nr:hypothetical protein CROQUDRAFT_95448 [Cronartium quercuum f. sp. fusiforme G11]
MCVTGMGSAKRSACNASTPIPEQAGRPMSGQTRLLADPRRLIAYSDGSLIPGQGVGAAAVVPSAGTTVKLKLGGERNYTRLTPLSSTFDLFVDNQPALMALSQRLRRTPGLHLRREAQMVINSLLDVHSYTRLKLVWCPAHQGIKGNEEADEAAKEATTLEDHRPAFPTSLSAQTARHTQPGGSTEALAALPRPEASAIAQLRANHSPLFTYLHRIEAADSPNCDLCGQPETTEHFLLTPARPRAAAPEDPPHHPQYPHRPPSLEGNGRLHPPVIPLLPSSPPTADPSRSSMNQQRPPTRSSSPVTCHAQLALHPVRPPPPPPPPPSPPPPRSLHRLAPPFSALPLPHPLFHFVLLPHLQNPNTHTRPPPSPAQFATPLDSTQHAHQTKHTFT